MLRVRRVRQLRSHYYFVPRLVLAVIRASPERFQSDRRYPQRSDKIAASRASASTAPGNPRPADPNAPSCKTCAAVAPGQCPRVRARQPGHRLADSARTENSDVPRRVRTNSRTGRRILRANKCRERGASNPASRVPADPLATQRQRLRALAWRSPRARPAPVLSPRKLSAASPSETLPTKRTRRKALARRGLLKTTAHRCGLFSSHSASTSMMVCREGTIGLAVSSKTALTACRKTCTFGPAPLSHENKVKYRTPTYFNA